MEKRVAIVGAGPSGLTSIKQCLDDNLVPVCFEASDHTGGLWRYTEVNEKDKDPHSSIYRSVIINTSKEVMAFTDFPVPYDWPSFLHNKDVVKYFDMYAENFNLLPYIKFNSQIQRLSIRPDDRWDVRYLNKDKNEECEEIFDYVMVCIGHHRHPRMPNYIGMDKFTNKQIHSHFYRRASDYENKRVLVVGCGNSGMDISVELSTVASQVYLCARKGYLPWILPRRLFGHLPADQLATRFYRYLPSFLKDWLIQWIANYTVGPHPPEFKPKVPPSAHHPTVKTDFFERVATGTIIPKPNIAELKGDNSIEFVDGSVIENIDVVIYATGYDFTKFPFLNEEIVSGGKKVENQFGNDEYKENSIWLYKFIFPPRVHSIAFIGLVQATGAIMPVSDIQAQYVISFWTGNLSKIPTSEEMEKEINRTQEIIRNRFYHSARHTIQADMIPYMDGLAKDMGCLPYPTKILFKFGPRLWKQVLFGVPTPIHYRLLGRQSWGGAAEAIRIYNGCKPSSSTSKKTD